MPQTAELVSDIKTVLDISSRVDERVKLIQINQQELNARLNQVIAEFNQIVSRVSVLESKNGGRVHILEDELKNLRNRFERMDAAGSDIFQKTAEDTQQEFENLDDKFNLLTTRVQTLEHANEGWQSKLKHYGGLLIQGIWVIIVCYILFKLGINTPPIP